jgi:hypothetical protein
MEEQKPVPEKLKMAGIKPIEWSKVQDYIEDSLIAAVQIACSEFGDNQYEVSKRVKVNLESLVGGNWTVIICPVDQKTYNIHYTPAVIHDKGNYISYEFTFEYLERRYLIFRTA